MSSLFGIAYLFNDSSGFKLADFCLVYSSLFFQTQVKCYLTLSLTASNRIPFWSAVLLYLLIHIFLSMFHAVFSIVCLYVYPPKETIKFMIASIALVTLDAYHTKGA